MPLVRIAISAINSTTQKKKKKEKRTKTYHSLLCIKQKHTRSIINPPDQTTYSSITTLKGLTKAPPKQSPSPICTSLTPSILIKKCTTLLSTAYPDFFHLAFNQSASASLLFAQSYLCHEDRIRAVMGEGGHTSSGLSVMVEEVEEVEEVLLWMLEERERYEDEKEEVGLWQRDGIMRLRSDRLGM
jgi:hypothetical protein